MKNLLILILCAVVVWFGMTIVRLENYNYGNVVGFCNEYSSQIPQERIKKDECLNSKQTRTNPFIHLAYALGIL